MSRSLWLSDGPVPATHVQCTTVAAAVAALVVGDVAEVVVTYDPRVPACAACRGGVACARHPSAYGLLEWLARNPSVRVGRLLEQSHDWRAGLWMLAHMQRLGWALDDTRTI